MSEQKSNTEAVYNVDEEQLALVYAKAFLGAARSAGDIEGLVAELRSLVEDVFDPFPDFETAIGAHSLSHTERVNMIDAVFKGRASETVLHLFKVLSLNDRTGSMRMVAKMVHKLHGESQGRRQVQILTAQPLSQELTTELRDAIQTKLGIEPEFSMSVDPELIAGMVIQVGDTVYDGSVRTSLERARQQMVASAIEAIENRPDKFVAEKIEK